MAVIIDSEGSGAFEPVEVDPDHTNPDNAK